MVMELSDRMKLYEDIGAGQMLVPNLPVMVRIDGKAFHSWTRGLDRPFDLRLQTLFDEVTKFLIDESNAVIGYTQSDEITLILWNFAKPESQVLFNGRTAKLTSVLASLATVQFNALVPLYLPQKTHSLACFDCRVWNVPSEEEAVNCLIWREQDAVRNSIQSASQARYSPKQLHQKNTSDMQEMLWQKGVNWNEYDARCKRGGYFRRRRVERTFTPEELDKLPPQHEAFGNPDLKVIRHSLDAVNLPILTTITNRVETIFYDEVPKLESKVA